MPIDICTIYISGGISGLSQCEVARKFGNAQANIEKLGYKAVNPFEEVQCGGFNWYYDMAQCFQLMGKCDAILMLDGWEQSKGANIELITMLLQEKPCVTIEILEKSYEYWQQKEKTDGNRKRN